MPPARPGFHATVAYLHGLDCLSDYLPATIPASGIFLQDWNDGTCKCSNFGYSSATPCFDSIGPPSHIAAGKGSVDHSCSPQLLACVFMCVCVCVFEGPGLAPYRLLPSAPCLPPACSRSPHFAGPARRCCLQSTSLGAWWEPASMWAPTPAAPACMSDALQVGRPVKRQLALQVVAAICLFLRLKPFLQTQARCRWANLSCHS